MLIGGLWHGASFTFIIWGAYHGLLLVVERLIGEERLQCIPIRVRQALTFLLVIVGWVFFRSESFVQAGKVLGGMMGLNGLATQINPALAQKHFPSVLLVLAAFYFWVRIEPRVVGNMPMSSRIFSQRNQWILFAGFLVALLFSMSGREIPFLYFQF
jgi:alginate O-acetyltransferase complex protein AlgI